MKTLFGLSSGSQTYTFFKHLKIALEENCCLQYVTEIRGSIREILSGFTRLANTQWKEGTCARLLHSYENKKAFFSQERNCKQYNLPEFQSNCFLSLTVCLSRPEIIIVFVTKDTGPDFTNIFIFYCAQKVSAVLSRANKLSNVGF